VKSRPKLKFGLIDSRLKLDQKLPPLKSRKTLRNTESRPRWLYSKQLLLQPPLELLKLMPRLPLIRQLPLMLLTPLETDLLIKSLRTKQESLNGLSRMHPSRLHGMTLRQREKQITPKSKQRHGPQHRLHSRLTPQQLRARSKQASKREPLRPRLRLRRRLPKLRRQREKPLRPLKLKSLKLLRES